MRLNCHCWQETEGCILSAMIFAILLGITVTAAALAIIWVFQDGGPGQPRTSWDKNEWSQELPSRPYASRFNQQFSSAWGHTSADGVNRGF